MTEITIARGSRILLLVQPDTEVWILRDPERAPDAHVALVSVEEGVRYRIDCTEEEPPERAVQRAAFRGGALASAVAEYDKTPDEESHG